MSYVPEGLHAPDEESNVVRGWEPCMRALAKPELVSDPHLIGLEPNPTNNLLMMEGDLHTQVRRLVAPYFTPPRIAGLRPQLEELAASLVEDVRRQPDADLVADLAEPVVLDAMFSAMEVSHERRAELGRLARDMIGWLEPDLDPETRRRANNAALRATAIFTRDGLDGKAAGLHARLEAAARDRVIPEKVVRSTPVVVIHGGYENPLHQLGCLIAWAVENPGRFASAAESAPNMLVEEILRVYSPVRRVARWATSDGIDDGLVTRRGELVWIDLESAHDDRERFASEEVDVSEQRRHLGFGYGRHGCPGSSLARLEGEVLIQALLTIPAAELREFVVGWREGVVAHGPATITRRCP